MLLCSEEYNVRFNFMRNEPWKYGVPKRIKDSNFTFTKLQQSSFSETFFCSTHKKNINKILMNINSPTLYCFQVICDHKIYAQKTGRKLSTCRTQQVIIYKRIIFSVCWLHYEYKEDCLQKCT